MSRTNIYTGLCARQYSKHQCVHTHTHTHTHTHIYTLIQSSHQSFGLTTSILQMKKQRQIKVKLLSKIDTQRISREQGFKGRHHGGVWGPCSSRETHFLSGVPGEMDPHWSKCLAFPMLPHYSSLYAIALLCWITLWVNCCELHMHYNDSCLYISMWFIFIRYKI